jgi:hypothetical protein
VLDRLLKAVRAGQSRALVVRGEPGVGKTALLEYVVAQASDCRVDRAAGVQSEMEVAFAGLHQLCAPMLNRLERLPDPQRDALRTTFGLAPGRPADRLLVGLAVLGLLAEVARERPLVCVVDDAQWLDRASAEVLTFVARRLVAESVGLVFASRGEAEDEPSSGLPELVVAGLPDADARELLRSALPGLVNERVRDRIIAETRGNPLALLELPRGLTLAELACGFWSAGQPSCSASSPRPPNRRLRPGLSRSARGPGSGTRCCARRSTGRPPPRSGTSRTGRWPRSPIPTPILIGALGTVPRRRTGPVRTSRRISSALPDGRGRAVAWPPRPRSWNGPPS